MRGRGQGCMGLWGDGRREGWSGGLCIGRGGMGMMWFEMYSSRTRRLVWAGIQTPSFALLEGAWRGWSFGSGGSGEGRGVGKRERERETIVAVACRGCGYSYGVIVLVVNMAWEEFGYWYR
jgi:hypothetical protein